MANDQRVRLKDYKRAGVSHYEVVELAKQKAREENDRWYNDIDRITGKTISEEARKAHDNLTYTVYSTDLKKQAYKELVDDAAGDYAYHSKQAKKWASANKAVMNMPADSSNRQYRKAIKAGKKAVG